MWVFKIITVSIILPIIAQIVPRVVTFVILKLALPIVPTVTGSLR